MCEPREANISCMKVRVGRKRGLVALQPRRTDKCMTQRAACQKREQAILLVSRNGLEEGEHHVTLSVLACISRRSRVDL